MGGRGSRSQKPTIDHLLIFTFEFVHFEAYDFRNTVINLYSVLRRPTNGMCFDILLKYLFKLLSLKLIITTATMHNCKFVTRINKTFNLKQNFTELIV